MNFFEQLVIPPTAAQNTLLNIVQVVSFLLFYPFAGMILGGLILSVYFNYKGTKTGNSQFTEFAGLLISKLTISRNAGYTMILVPALSIAIIYAQFLYSAKVISISIIFISIIIYLIALVYTYKFRTSFELSAMFEKIDTDETKEFKDKLTYEKPHNGKFALLLFLLASFLFIGAMTVASNMNEWNSVNNIMQMFFSGSVWMNFIYFIISSLSIASVTALFFFYSWQGGIKFKNEEFEKFARKTSANTALISTIILPIFLFLSSVSLPKEAMSSGVLIFSGIALIALLIVCNFLYAIIKNSELKYAGLAFSVLLLAFVFIIIKNQIAFSNAVKSHVVIVNNTAETRDNENSPKTNKAAEISGEDIYKGRCSACHSFEVKVVGPPYKETVPKYNGDEKKLAQFIYNPTKVNPDFPPMPNQGLKMKEAEAVAKYIIEQLKKK